VTTERTTSTDTLFEFGDFRLDASRGALLRGEDEIHLRPKSFRVLEYLVRNPSRLVTRRELMDAVWGPAIVTDDSLTQCLIDIRRALGDEGQQVVRTVPRRGFIFESAVTAPRRSEAEAGEHGDASPPASSPGVAPAEVGPPLPAPQRTWTVPVLVGLAALLGLVAWWLLGRPVETVAVAPPTVADTAPQGSIAVLRFADLSPSGDKQYFADGLAEEVMHRLAQSPDLTVTARSSSFAMGTDGMDIREIAARLNVAHVLEGSVRREGDDLRVTAQLIDARTGAHVWSKRFDGKASDLMTLQDDIAAAVAGSLHATLAARAWDAARIDPAAEELFLQGQYVYNRRGPGDVALARDYFERAIAIQPDHARALTALAGALRIQALDGGMDWDESFATQQALLTRALASDPGLAEAHVRLSNVQYALGRAEEARATFARGVELGPTSPLVLGMQAGQALGAGRFDEAVALSAQVARLDPLSAVSHGNHGYMLLAAGRLEEAEAALRRAADLGGLDLSTDIARIRVLQARFGDAVELAREAPPGLERDLVLAMAAPVAGTPEEADAALERLRTADTRASNAMLAEVLAFQGHTDEAFAALERAVAGSTGTPRRIDVRRETAADWQRAANVIRVSPFLAPLRTDPRWADYARLSW
jgi:TolB-like protein/DNA-binding winged helix-turn-helix (wHTH) protein/tetratricopeptide (TPR) repeat protein